MERQLAQAMRNNRREIQSSRSRGGSEGSREEIDEEEASDSSQEERRPRRSRRSRPSNLDFKVEIPEFEGQLDPDDFLDCLKYH